MTFWKEACIVTIWKEACMGLLCTIIRGRKRSHQESVSHRTIALAHEHNWAQLSTIEHNWAQITSTLARTVACIKAETPRWYRRLHWFLKKKKRTTRAGWPRRPTSAHRVACIGARRLGHPARAGIFFWIFFSLLPTPLPGLKPRIQKASWAVPCYVLGCNNGIGGFLENLVTFKRTKLPDFWWSQKMRFKKCSSEVQQKKWPVRALLYDKQKWRKTPTDSAVTEAK